MTTHTEREAVGAGSRLALAAPGDTPRAPFDPTRLETAKVLVATPNYTNLYSAEVHMNHVECAVAWTRAGLAFNWLVIGRTFVHFARTQACQIALRGGFTHVFWLDDDAVISPSLLPRYLAHGKEVVITPYFMRRPPYECGVLTSATGDFHDHASYRNLGIADLRQGLVEVDGGGTHAMLVETSVLTRHGSNDTPEACHPHLRAFVARLSPEDRSVVDHFVGTLPDERDSLADEDRSGVKPFFMMPKQGTEDMLFCYRLKRKGVRIWCDTDATSGHVGFAPVVTEAFRARAEALGLPAAAQQQAGVAQLMTLPLHDIQAGDGDPQAVSSTRSPVVDTTRAGSLV